MNILEDKCPRMQAIGCMDRTSNMMLNKSVESEHLALLPIFSILLSCVMSAVIPFLQLRKFPSVSIVLEVFTMTKCYIL